MLFCAEVPFSQQRKVQIGIPSDLNEPRLRRHASQRYVGRAKRESAGRGRRKFPGGTLLDLDEHRRELIQKDSHPVAVTSPDGLAAASAVAHYCDRGPRFDPRNFQVRDLPDRIAEPARIYARLKARQSYPFRSMLACCPRGRAVRVISLK